MKIGEVAKRAGVSTDTVRIYERMGLLPRAARSHAGYRDFGEDVPTRVADIKVLQSVGMALGEIQSVLAAPDAGRHTCGSVEPALRETVARLDRHIERLISLRDAAEVTRASCATNACGSESGCHANVC